MADMNDSIKIAADAISNANALLIGAGAGMGVDSGLPDFRGSQGFWQAYPRYKELGLDFQELANPRWFHQDPAMAWGFYGHRLNLYRSTRPHIGFSILNRWADNMTQGGFVFTSNVDGQFQEAGFDPEKIVECHGAIRWMQCQARCGAQIFPAADGVIMIDELSMKAKQPLPACPDCHGLARPNILMFGDAAWKPERTEVQERNFASWKRQLRQPRLVVIECGAGSAIPSVRLTCEAMTRMHKGILIRINPRESRVPGPTDIGLPMGASQAIRAINKLLSR